MNKRWGIVSEDYPGGFFKAVLCSGMGEHCERVTVHKLSKEEARETVVHWIKKGSVLIKL